MAEKLKYNKTALKAQRDAKAKYEKFLPILQLKKMQLQLVIRQLEPIIEEKRRSLKETADRATDQPAGDSVLRQILNLDIRGTGRPLPGLMHEHVDLFDWETGFLQGLISEVGIFLCFE